MIYHPSRFFPLIVSAVILSAGSPAVAKAGDGDFLGTFEPKLAAGRDNDERIVFKPVSNRATLKVEEPIDDGATVTAATLLDLRTEKPAIAAILVESTSETPYVLADVDLDGTLEAAERVDLEPDPGGNQYRWHATLALPIEGGTFTSLPMHLEYFFRTRWEGMIEGERLFVASRDVYARGIVDIAGRKTLVQYAFNPKSKKVDIMNGTLGIDSNGDGEIDSDRFSAESARADAEVVVFRVGGTYVSTKKADIAKNQITMRSHQASDYKRVELAVGTVMPEFEFTDFDGKRHKISEYRGKYVLLDFWGMWCPPCRAELPHLKAAYERFQPRGFEIVGMNTDSFEAIPGVRKTLRENGMGWVQAKRESIEHVIRGLRISSYPTTVLLGPDGRVVSLNNTDKGQPSLRGHDIVETIQAVMQP